MNNSFLLWLAFSLFAGSSIWWALQIFPIYSELNKDAAFWAFFCVGMMFCCVQNVVKKEAIKNV